MTPKSPRSRVTMTWLALTALAVLGYGAICLFVGLNQRSLLYFPSHTTTPTHLAPWTINGEIIGYCRSVARPHAVWLMTHGNGGQAGARAYVLPRMSPADSLYVLEYPGYGLRAGSPSQSTINAAALAAYQALRREFPTTPVCVLGESIGSGPASYLGSITAPPDKIILVVPFDALANVAAARMPFLPARLLLQDRWDNIAALQSYAGPVEIYAAPDDHVITFSHAKNLADHLKAAKFIAIEGGHNDWSTSPRVRIER